MKSLALARYGLALAAVLFAALAGTAAAAVDDLYRSQTIVTGQGEAERARGFALCLEAVLVKVSGDPRLIGLAEVEAMKAHASDLVRDFTYEDRMKGIPLHDEQGTRDRPFDLTVAFDPAKVDAALRTLGRAPWPEPRAKLVVLLGVRDARGASYVLAGEGERGLGQRQSLAAVAEKRGVPLRLPESAKLAAADVTYDGLAAMAPAGLQALAKASGGDAALAGTLVWIEAAPGWTVRWRLSWQGSEHRWAVAGVSFDDAFRNGIDGAASILSGHGPPTAKERASWPVTPRRSPSPHAKKSGIPPTPCFPPCCP